MKDESTLQRGSYVSGDANDIGTAVLPFLSIYHHHLVYLDPFLLSLPRNEKPNFLVNLCFTPLKTAQLRGIVSYSLYGLSDPLFPLNEPRWPCCGC